ncbi:MAG: hypothetical protein GY859_09000 [Desulfobacterales bacterium]|nr:hypothetical protein [Desulfobacterales bacterium]
MRDATNKTFLGRFQAPVFDYFPFGLFLAGILCIVAALAWNVIDIAAPGPGAGGGGDADSLFSRRSALLGVSSVLYVMLFFHIQERLSYFRAKIEDEQSRKIANENRLTQSRLKLLQAQIEPHFLFNTLTSIVSLDETDSESAKRMQLNFIHYLEASLIRTRDSETTVSGEAELIRAYLELFKIRMGDRLRYSIDMEEDIREASFPSMLIQPIVENAVKHGLEPKIDGGEIAISVKKRGGRLIWEIADTGLGMSEEAPPGMGLSNIIERLNYVYGDEGQLLLEENSPRGLKVIIEAPYAQDYSDHRG